MSSRLKGVTNVVLSRWTIVRTSSSPRCSQASTFSWTAGSVGSDSRSRSRRAHSATLAADSLNRPKKASSVGTRRNRRALRADGQVADAFGDVHGMVAEALIEPPHQGGLQGVRQGDVGYPQLVDQLVVQAVDAVVDGVEVLGRLGVALGPGVGGG